MSTLQSVTLKMTFDGVPCEVLLGRDETEDVITFDDVKNCINYAKSIGFVAPVQWTTKGGANDVVGKIGTVTEVKKTDAADDRKGFTVSIVIDGTEDKIEVKTWVMSAFRKGDRVKIVKNDKGYLNAELFDDSPKQSGLTL